MEKQEKCAPLKRYRHLYMEMFLQPEPRILGASIESGHGQGKPCLGYHNIRIRAWES